MKTVAVTIDDETFAKAEQKAVALATSVPEVVANYLRQWTSEEERIAEARRQMKELFEHPKWEFGVGVPDTREERNARR